MEFDLRLRPVLDLPGVVERMPGRAPDGLGGRPAGAAAGSQGRQITAVARLQRVEERGPDGIDTGPRRCAATELGQVGALRLALVVDDVGERPPAAARSL